LRGAFFTRPPNRLRLRRRHHVISISIDVTVIVIIVAHLIRLDLI
jgi:hypothetical protein